MLAIQTHCSQSSCLAYDAFSYLPVRGYRRRILRRCLHRAPFQPSHTIGIIRTVSCASAPLSPGDVVDLLDFLQHEAAPYEVVVPPYAQSAVAPAYKRHQRRTGQRRTPGDGGAARPRRASQPTQQQANGLPNTDGLPSTNNPKWPRKRPAAAAASGGLSTASAAQTEPVDESTSMAGTQAAPNTRATPLSATNPAAAPRVAQQSTLTAFEGSSRSAHGSSRRGRPSLQQPAAAAPTPSATADAPVTPAASIAASAAPKSSTPAPTRAAGFTSASYTPSPPAAATSPSASGIPAASSGGRTSRDDDVTAHSSSSSNDSTGPAGNTTRNRTRAHTTSPHQQLPQPPPPPSQQQQPSRADPRFQPQLDPQAQAVSRLLAARRAAVQWQWNRHLGITSATSGTPGAAAAGSTTAKPAAAPVTATNTGSDAVVVTTRRSDAAGEVSERLGLQQQQQEQQQEWQRQQVQHSAPALAAVNAGEARQAPSRAPPTQSSGLPVTPPSRQPAAAAAEPPPPPPPPPSSSRAVSGVTPAAAAASMNATAAPNHPRSLAPQPSNAPPSQPPPTTPRLPSWLVPLTLQGRLARMDAALAAHKASRHAPSASHAPTSAPPSSTAWDPSRAPPQPPRPHTSTSAVPAAGAGRVPSKGPLPVSAPSNEVRTVGSELPTWRTGAKTSPAAATHTLGPAPFAENTRSVVKPLPAGLTPRTPGLPAAAAASSPSPAAVDAQALPPEVAAARELFKRLAQYRPVGREDGPLLLAPHARYQRALYQAAAQASADRPDMLLAPLALPDLSYIAAAYAAAGHKYEPFVHALATVAYDKMRSLGSFGKVASLTKQVADRSDGDGSGTTDPAASAAPLTFRTACILLTALARLATYAPTTAAVPYGNGNSNGAVVRLTTALAMWLARLLKSGAVTPRAKWKGTWLAAAVWAYATLQRNTSCGGVGTTPTTGAPAVAGTATTADLAASTAAAGAALFTEAAEAVRVAPGWLHLLDCREALWALWAFKVAAELYGTDERATGTFHAAVAAAAAAAAAAGSGAAAGPTVAGAAGPAWATDQKGSSVQVDREASTAGGAGGVTLLPAHHLGGARAHVRYEPDALIELKLAARAMSQFAQLDPGQLAEAFALVAQAGLAAGDPQLLAELRRCSLARAAATRPLPLAVMVAALAVMQVQDVVWLSGLAAACRNQMINMQPEQIVVILHSFTAALRFYYPPLFHAAAVMCTLPGYRRLAHMGPAEVVRLLGAFAAAGHYERVLMRVAPEHVLSLGPSASTPWQRATLLHLSARLAHRSNPLLRAVAAETFALPLPPPPPSSVSPASTPAAPGMPSERPVTAPPAAAATPPPAVLVATVAAACGQLQYRPPGLLAAMAEARTAVWPRLGLGHKAALCWSLLVLTGGLAGGGDVSRGAEVTNSGRQQQQQQQQPQKPQHYQHHRQLVAALLEYLRVLGATPWRQWPSAAAAATAAAATATPAASAPGASAVITGAVAGAGAGAAVGSYYHTQLLAACRVLAWRPSVDGRYGLVAPAAAAADNDAVDAADADAASVPASADATSPVADGGALPPTRPAAAAAAADAKGASGGGDSGPWSRWSAQLGSELQRLPVAAVRRTLTAQRRVRWAALEAWAVQVAEVMRGAIEEATQGAGASEEGLEVEEEEEGDGGGSGGGGGRRQQRIAVAGPAAMGRRRRFVLSGGRVSTGVVLCEGALAVDVCLELEVSEEAGESGDMENDMEKREEGELVQGPAVSQLQLRQRSSTLMVALELCAPPPPGGISSSSGGGGGGGGVVRNSRWLLSGSAALRRRLLSRLGWSVLAVREGSWRELRSPQQQRRSARGLLRQALRQMAAAAAAAAVTTVAINGAEDGGKIGCSSSGSGGGGESVDGDIHSIGEESVVGNTATTASVLGSFAGDGQRGDENGAGASAVRLREGVANEGVHVEPSAAAGRVADVAAAGGAADVAAVVAPRKRGRPRRQVAATPR